MWGGELRYKRITKTYCLGFRSYEEMIWRIFKTAEELEKECEKTKK